MKLTKYSALLFGVVFIAGSCIAMEEEEPRRVDESEWQEAPTPGAYVFTGEDPSQIDLTAWWPNGDRWKYIGTGDPTQEKVPRWLRVESGYVFLDDVDPTSIDLKKWFAFDSSWVPREVRSDIVLSPSESFYSEVEGEEGLSVSSYSEGEEEEPSESSYLESEEEELILKKKPSEPSPAKKREKRQVVAPAPAAAQQPQRPAVMSANARKARLNTMFLQASRSNFAGVERTAKGFHAQGGISRATLDNLLVLAQRKDKAGLVSQINKLR